jgi:putative ABC transport system permease protein
MLSDLRYAVRTLRKNWGFTFAAVTALGLGIGATTTIFSLLTPFIVGFQSVEDIDRIVTVWSSNAARGADMSVVSLPDFTDSRDATDSFEGLAAREVRVLNLVGLAISLAITRLIAGILFQVSSTDPLTFGGVTLLLGGIGLLASLIPALRAGRLQPVAALRDE